MSVPASPLPRRSSPRRPSRIKIAAIWFVLLLGSFLFGLLIISPLLGAILSGRDDDSNTAAPKKSAPARARSQSSQAPAVLSREQPMPARVGAGIEVSPDESESVVEASDRVDIPVDGIHSPPPDPSTELQPSNLESAAPAPGPAAPPSEPPSPGGIQRPESID